MYFRLASSSDGPGIRILVSLRFPTTSEIGVVETEFFELLIYDILLQEVTNPPMADVRSAQLAGKVDDFHIRPTSRVVTFL